MALRKAGVAKAGPHDVHAFLAFPTFLPHPIHVPVPTLLTVPTRPPFTT